MTTSLKNIISVLIIAFIYIAIQHKSGYIASCEASHPLVKSNLSPLDQFLIKDFLSFYFNIGFNIKFLFTNMSFYLVIITSLVFILNVIYIASYQN